MGDTGDVPEDRCGFTFETPSHSTASCCYRSTWRDYDSCIWHADVEGTEKPFDELEAARVPEAARDRARGTGPRELLDGARLVGCEFPEGIDLDGVYLRAAALSGVALRNADWTEGSAAASTLTDADLRDSDLTGWDAKAARLGEADLRSTSLAGADLFDAALDDALLAEAELRDADLRNVAAEDAVFTGAAMEGGFLDAATLDGTDWRDATLTDATLVDATLPGATLDEAVLDAARLVDADLSDASLKQCSLRNVTASGATFQGANLQEATLEAADLMAATLTETNLALADLTDAYLLEATLTNAHLVEATLANATIDSARIDDARLQEASLRGASLRSASLVGSDCRGVDFTDATLRDADLTNCSLAQARLRNATLERAVLTQADLFAADLQGGRWYGAVFAEARISDQTTFGTYCAYDPRSETAVEDSTEVDQLTKAAGAYQELEKLCRENALAEQQSHYFIRRQDIYRDQHRQAGRRGRAARARAARIVTLYGERPGRVIGTSVVVIVGCGLAYPLLGGVVLPSGGDPVAIAAPLGIPLDQLPGGTWLASIYFSLVTFTTLGYGDIQPATALGQTLAGLESIVGAALMALLVAVLSRRLTR